MLNHLTILVCFCKNLPNGMDKSRPVNAGMDVSMPTWKEVAFRCVRKTGRNGEAAVANPTPIAST
jgi:hypothetical protein